MSTPTSAATALALRQVRRGGLIVALLTAGMSALVAVQYRTAVAGSLDVASLRALAENPAISTLFGPARALDDAGGFTVWRTGTVVAVLVATWAFLVATRILRGEEDAGRWALLLSGTLTVRQALARHLFVLLGVNVVVALLIAGALVAAETSPVGAVSYGVGIGLVGALFAAIGALAAQVLPDRRSAAGACAAVLVVSLLLRMVADGVAALGWLSWVTPFGLLGEIRPYAGNRPAPMYVLLVAVAAAAGAALALAYRRDIGSALLRMPDRHRTRPAMLTSLTRFLVRRTLRPLVAWASGISAYFLLIGLLAESMTQFLRENPRFAERAQQAGFGDLGTVEGYAASLFGLLAVPVGLFAAGRFAADADDEEAGRLATVFSAPVRRSRWVALHAVVVAAAAVVLCVVAGTSMWLGAQAVEAPLSFHDSLAGAVNAAPVAFLSVAAAVLALGRTPRSVPAIGATPVVGGFVLYALADSLSWPDVVRDVSPFAHLAAVPAREPNVAAAMVMVALTLVVTAIGTAGYARRDLRASGS